MDLYGAVYRSLAFPIWETRIRRRPVWHRLRELERSQWRPLGELVALQRRALGDLLAHAYAHVPFYRRRFDEAGMTPADVANVEDLRRLPLVRRAELRSATDRASLVPPFPTVRKQTSGTTGEPLLFGHEPDSEDWRRAVKYRGYGSAGYHPGDRALFFWGAPETPDGRWAQRAKVALDRRLRREIYTPCAVMSDAHLREAVRLIEARRPQVIVCYAQAGAELARFVTRHGLRTWPTVPVVCGAEPLLPRDRADLTAAFGPAVFDTYGCREVMMIGAECEAHDGLHVAMENVLVEIVVTEGGEGGVERPAREGEAGEVVLTDLHNLAMPFIRYANGDVAVAGSAERCACGRTLPRISAVHGRSADTLRARDGAPVSGIAVSFLVKDLRDAIRRFQAVQHRDGSVSLRLLADGELPRVALESVRSAARALLGGLEVSVEIVADLPTNRAGKHRLVVVES